MSPKRNQSDDRLRFFVADFSPGSGLLGISTQLRLAKVHIAACLAYLWIIYLGV